MSFRFHDIYINKGFDIEQSETLIIKTNVVALIFTVVFQD
jgi:hypothetical protein